MMYWVKGTTVNRYSVNVGRCKGEEAFNSLTMRSQPFSESVSLDCEFHKCFLVLPHFMGQDATVG